MTDIGLTRVTRLSVRSADGWLDVLLVHYTWAMACLLTFMLVISDTGLVVWCVCVCACVSLCSPWDPPTSCSCDPSCSAIRGMSMLQFAPRKTHVLVSTILLYRSHQRPCGHDFVVFYRAC